MSSAYDVAIIGGGIVGLATAYQLLRRHPAKLVLLEKERELASHQTAHNSGVVHAGLYYAPGSSKARLCREGKALLEGFARKRGIPCERVGKLVVAVEEADLPRLRELHERASANGVPDLEEVGPERLREIEPHAAGLRALWSPTTAITDFRAIALACADDARRLGAEVRTGFCVRAIRRLPAELVLSTPNGDVSARHVIACAGLQSDRVAALTGDGGDERIVPFRGNYYTLRREARRLVRGLIYPVPDPRFPFLGVHLTRRIDGEVLAGPNAVLAGAREGYRRTDVSLRDLFEALRFRGFRRLARAHWRTGLAELGQDCSKRAFAARVARYVPNIAPEDLALGPSGVRAQSVSADGRLVDDFSIAESRRAIHVRNAPSPAATACFAIGREVAELAIARFEL